MSIKELKAAAEGATLRSEEIGEYEWYKSKELALVTGNVINPLDGDLIAAADPSTILELIGNIEALEARIKELEQYQFTTYTLERVRETLRKLGIAQPGEEQMAVNLEAAILSLCRGIDAAIAKEQT